MKVTMYLSLLVISSVAHSQNGSVFLETQFNYSSSQNSNTFFDDGFRDEFSGAKGFQLKQSIGVFPNNHWNYGIGFLYANETSRTRLNSADTLFSSSDLKLDSYQVSQFFRYLLPLKEDLYFSPRFEMYVGWTDYSRHNENPISETEATSLGLTLTPELTYFLSDKWALVGSIGRISFSRNKFRSNQNRNERSSSINRTYSNFNVSIGLNSMLVGIQYYLKNSFPH